MAVGIDTERQLGSQAGAHFIRISVSPISLPVIAYYATIATPHWHGAGIVLMPMRIAPPKRSRCCCVPRRHVLGTAPRCILGREGLHDGAVQLQVVTNSTVRANVKPEPVNGSVIADEGPIVQERVVGDASSLGAIPDAKAHGEARDGAHGIVCSRGTELILDLR